MLASCTSATSPATAFRPSSRRPLHMRQAAQCTVLAHSTGQASGRPTTLQCAGALRVSHAAGGARQRLQVRGAELVCVLAQDLHPTGAQEGGGGRWAVVRHTQGTRLGHEPSSRVVGRHPRGSRLDRKPSSRAVARHTRDFRLGRKPTAGQRAATAAHRASSPGRSNLTLAAKRERSAGSRSALRLVAPMKTARAGGGDVGSSR